MLRLRGIHNGETFEIHVSKGPTTAAPPSFECRLTMPDGSEKHATVEVISRIGSRWTLKIDGKIEDLVICRPDDHLLIDWNNRNYRLSLANAKDVHSQHTVDHPADPNIIRAEMTGKVVTVSKGDGDSVAFREPLATIEAMKMLNQVQSPKAGTVRRCHIEAGTIVSPGDLLFEIE